MNETASEIADSMKLIARAMCIHAATTWGKTTGEVREIAAVYWLDVLNDFQEVKVTEQTRNYLASFFKIDPKDMSRGVPGR